MPGGCVWFLFGRLFCLPSLRLPHQGVALGPLCAPSSSTDARPSKHKTQLYDHTTSAAPFHCLPPPFHSCDGEGRVLGGLGAVPGFGWWPIKAYRPCDNLGRAGVEYTRCVRLLKIGGDGARARGRACGWEGARCGDAPGLCLIGSDPVVNATSCPPPPHLPSRACMSNPLPSPNPPQTLPT